MLSDADGLRNHCMVDVLWWRLPETIDWNNCVVRCSLTVHSHCVESFEGHLQQCRRGRGCSELWKNNILPEHPVPNEWCLLYGKHCLIIAFWKHCLAFVHDKNHCWWLLMKPLLPGSRCFLNQLPSRYYWKPLLNRSRRGNRRLQPLPTRCFLNPLQS